MAMVDLARVGDIHLRGDIKRAQLMRIARRLRVHMLDVCEWYRQQVASFQYTYFRGYPFVEERLRQIIMAADIGEIAQVTVQQAGDRIFFKIKMFDDDPGGWLDKATPTHGVNGQNSLGWWRYFEFGAPGQRNWGSDKYGFIPSRSKSGGAQATGWMAPVDGSNPGPRPKRTHPGVYKVGVFEKTWRVLRGEFRERARKAIREALKQ